MSVRLWPKDYQNKMHITKNEKLLLRRASNNFINGHFVVDIDPLKMNDGEHKTGFYLSPSEGLITFTVFSGNMQKELKEFYKMYTKMIEDKIYKRLLDSKCLITRNKENKFLKFPYKHILIFPDEVSPRDTFSEIDICELNPFLVFRFFKPLFSMGKEKTITELQLFSNLRKTYDLNFNGIDELGQRAIFSCLAPEYTVVINEVEEIKIPENNKNYSDDEMKITGKESSFKTFFLDEYQVNLVNDMGKGHRVILANPGAGKSVLLLSKAFKYSSMYKDSKVLLTCYNNNLSDLYGFKRKCANFEDDNNLYIMTFHKLVKKIYEEILNERCQSNIATTEEIQKCINKIKKGDINLRFKAIFIDEVQVFEPMYLELCYLLLEKSESTVFLMAGDLNQTVRNKSRRGDVPWKKMEGFHLDFTGRVKYIQKNYRNSEEIAKYLKNMLGHMNKRMEMLNLINYKEFEYNYFEIGHDKTIAFKTKIGLSKNEITLNTISAIKEISEKYKIPFSDIAVLFPYKKHSSVRYFMLSWLEKYLNEENIPYSIIMSSGNFDRKKYSQTTGVVLSTIDSSLGLDFKAVILTGLYPYNYVFGNGYKKEIASWNSIQEMDEIEQMQVQSQMRAIYTASSRAREVLYVLSDLKAGSPMEEILIDRR